MDLRLRHYSRDGIRIIDVGGDVDVFTAPRLRELLTELIQGENQHQLLINLDGIDFLDSTGLGVLVGGFKRLRVYDDGWLDLVCGQEQILKILRITGLTDVFDIYGTVDEAIEAHRPTRETR